MKTKKNSKGFVCVLDTPSLEGLVYIGACTEDPKKECEELSSNLSTQVKLLYAKESANPFKLLSLVHAILEEYRVYEGRDFFKVDSILVHDLIDDIEDRINKNYDKSSTEGRYEAVGYGLEGRPNLLGKRFKRVEELTSLGIDARFIFDHRKGRCLSRAFIPGFDDVDFDEEIDGWDDED